MKQKNINEAVGVEGEPFIFRKTLAYNQEAMLCTFEAKAHSKIPLHQHRATQIGYVLTGHIRFLGQNDTDAFEVRAGDSYVFDPNQFHGAEILEDSSFIEVFSPSRKEYQDF